MRTMHGSGGVMDIESRIRQAVGTANSATSSADPLVQVCWLISGLDLYHRSGGTVGHSLEEAQRYVVARILRGTVSGEWQQLIDEAVA